MAVIRTDGHEVNGKWVGLPRDFKVKPHVQAFADEAEATYGLDSFGTYTSHQPTPDRAVDCFGTLQEMRALAWSLTDHETIVRFGVDYAIFNIDEDNPGEIWNEEIAKAWRQMADRGGPTQNHHDHVHVSFNATAPATTEDDDMYDSAARDELVKRLDKIQGGLDEVFKKVVYLEETVAKVVAEQDG